jgi:WD40 repeat protein
LVVRKLDTEWYLFFIKKRCAQLTVGGSINNALSISDHGQQTRLLVCNNDETLKVYSLPNLEKVCSLTFPTAINYSAVSPDGRKMVVVGDSPEVFLYNITPNGTYEKMGSFMGFRFFNRGTNDAAFSCSWNKSSEKFAISSQDGFVSVWDIKSSEKLAKIPTTQVSISN